MRTKLQRAALMMDLRFKVKPRTKDPLIAAYPFSVPAIAKIAADSVAMKAVKEKVERTYKGGDVRAYLLDIAMITYKADDYLVLLLGISDKRPPDHVLVNTNTNNRKTTVKAREEADEYSSHIVIKLTPRLQHGQCFRLAYEEIPLLQSQYVERYLRNFFKEVSKVNAYYQNDPTGKLGTNGSPAIVNILLETDVTSVPSDELMEEIQNGILGEVELSREVPGKKAWDQKGFTIVKSDRLILEASIKQQVQSVTDLIESVCKSGAANNFTMAKFNWKTQSGNTKTVRFDCASESLLTKFFTKREIFTLQKPMAESIPNIEQSFALSLANWLP